MTVLSELSKIAYIGSSSQTLYPIPFEYINTDDVKVSIYTSNNEFVENWTYSVQYVIEDGNVKVLSGYNIDNTKKLLVLRRVGLVQDNKYREGGDFPAKSTETSFDKLTMITQQLQETLDRCVKVEVLDIQSPEELLQTVYDKLDSATEIAGDAISAANQAQTAADNATAAVNSAEQTLVQTQAYVDSAKVEINNTKNTAINTIDSTVLTAKSDINSTANNAKAEITSTVTQAKADINTAVSTAESNISTIVSDAEGSITNIAVTEANKAIANAAQEATDIAVAKLQPYVNQAQEDANSAAASMEQAALSATAASNYASNASADADNAAESAGLAANSASEAAIHNFKNKITNCITEIPQDIKLELNNGTLTLKAGSKVYVPNGAGVFDTQIIPSDLTLASYNGTYQEGVVWTNSGVIDSVNTNEFFSGNTTPSFTGAGVWYDTANNVCKTSRDSGSTWEKCSLPLCICAVDNGTRKSIDQVFNGFGYIGSTVFALPGVKGLIPNGRNVDGSLKNIEFTVGKVRTYTNASSRNNSYLALSANDNDSVGRINEFEVTDDISQSAKSKVIYSPTLNKNIISGGKEWKWGIVGQWSSTSTSPFNVTSLRPKTAFHAVDYQDVPKLATANTFTGNNTFTKQAVFANYPYNVIIRSNNIENGVTPATNQFEGIEFRDKNDARLAWMGVVKLTDGTQCVDFQKQGSTTAFRIPTPPTTDNSSQIATTAFVVNVLNTVYPVGSLFFSTASTCPLQAFGIGTWQNVGTSLTLSVNTDVPVKGNGMTLGLTNGSTNIAITDGRSDTNDGAYSTSVAFGKNVGYTTSIDNMIKTHKAVGVTTDSSKSGIVGTVTRTQITVNVFQRTA